MPNNKFNKPYKFVNQTYSKHINDSFEEELEIEIGDSKQSALFYPQFKLKRWGNEVNFSVRLKDKNYTTATVVTEDSKIKWKNDKREVHFYDVEADLDNPDGGHEIDVVLLEKPDTNVIEFTIETKGVDCFYQPPLTPEELDESNPWDGQQTNKRPDRAVGSYAIYHKNTPDNVNLGKLYRVGKVGHIYRPRIEDSAGHQVWGELSIDEQKKLLTVTIPQDFLDTSVYPVHHAAGFQMGYFVAGASSNTIENQIRASLFTSDASGGNAASIVFYSACSGAARTWAGNIYLHSTLAPVTNAATGTKTPDANTIWRVAAIATPPALSASTEYILAVWGSSGSGTHTVAYDAGTADQGHDDAETFGSWLATLVPSHTTNKYSIYISSDATGSWSSSSSSSISSSSSSRSSSSSSSSSSSRSSSSSSSSISSSSSSSSISSSSSSSSSSISSSSSSSSISSSSSSSSSSRSSSSSSSSSSISSSSSSSSISSSSSSSSISSSSSSSSSSISSSSSSSSSFSSSSSSSMESQSSSSSSSSAAAKVYSMTTTLDALPADDTDLATAFTAQDYTDVSLDDGDTVCQLVTFPNYAIFLFKEKYTGVATFTITWNGKSAIAPNTYPVSLQIYDRVGLDWETLQSNNTAGVNEEFNLTGNISADYEKYYDANFYISCRVYQGTS